MDRPQGLTRLGRLLWRVSPALLRAIVAGLARSERLYERHRGHLIVVLAIVIVVLVLREGK